MGTTGGISAVAIRKNYTSKITFDTYFVPWQDSESSLGATKVVV
nr:MAG TPA: hypothetical protein [Caudoviricetes sp.]